MDLDTIYIADDTSLESYNPEIYAGVLTKILRDIAPRLVMLADIYATREFGPAVSLRLGVPFLSNCIDLELSETGTAVTQPKYGGAVHVRTELEPVPAATLVSLGSSPDLPEMTRRHTPSVVPVAVEADTQDLRTKVIDTILETTGEFDIAKADIVVSGGRGLGTKENIRLIEEVAEALGGVIACSRPLYDMGWLPLDRLVGSCGKTVTPKVYLACGISGSPQHVWGMSGAQRIIAVNKSSEAPIFWLAHYGAIGDVRELLPAIAEEARRRLKAES
jgi:electron transfer flavoprotein alpha subunit